MLFYQKLSINILIHVDRSLPALLPLEAKRLLFAGGFAAGGFAAGGFAAGCVT